VHPRLLLALVLAGVLSLGGIVVGALGMSRERAEPAGTGTGARFEGSLMPAGVRAPDFTLRDQDGEPIRMRDLRGQPVIVTFLYTRCGDSCPPQAQQVKAALDELGRDVPALAVSVDPTQDTPASARHFLSKQGMIGRMEWALGTRTQLARVWKGFAIQPQLSDAEHQARIALVDGRGFQRVGFPLAQATPGAIAHDVRELAREQTG